MSAEFAEPVQSPTSAMLRAREVATAAGLRYVVAVPPLEAWALVQSGQAVAVS
jgi:hypothetical protein